MCITVKPVSMCKICGALVAETEHETVRMGGRDRALCQQCITRDIPMRRPAPGRSMEVSA